MERKRPASEQGQADGNALSRRGFLQAVLVTATGAVGIACRADEGPGAIADASGLDAPVAPDVGADLTPDAAETIVEPPLLDGDAFFPQSVASGDPGPASVVLWTRVADPARAAQDITLGLQLALDSGFRQRVGLAGVTELPVLASAAHDGCVRVRVDGLAARTTYYYRFVLDAGGERYASRSGRTKTAPAVDTDIPARLAIVAGQRFNGRWFNPLERLAELDVDAVVYLGSYVQERGPDAADPTSSPERLVDFGPAGGTIATQGFGSEPVVAAASLESYRHLYKTYRSDERLRRLHERFPIVAMWDDGEFSADAWGAHADYTRGREDEEDVARREAASRAWFEYMPVDYVSPAMAWSADQRFPDDLRVYRGLRFGRHLHLLLGDARSYRGPELVPEAAFPAAIAATEGEVEAAIGNAPAYLEHYVDIDTFEEGVYAAALRQAAPALGFEPELIHGLLSVPAVNGMIRDAGIALDVILEHNGMEHGLSYQALGKLKRFTRMGARTRVRRAAMNALDTVARARGETEHEALLGDAQRIWLGSMVGLSVQTWKLFACAPGFVPLTHNAPEGSQQDVLDASLEALIVTDDWNGRPSRRAELIRTLEKTPGVVAVTSHAGAALVGFGADPAGDSRRIPEIGVPPVSALTLREQLVRDTMQIPALVDAGGILGAFELEGRLTGTQRTPYLADVAASVHGFTVVEASAEALDVWAHLISELHADELLTDDALDDAFTVRRYRVELADRSLWRETPGGWERWDPAGPDWVGAG